MNAKLAAVPRAKLPSLGQIAYEAWAASKPRTHTVPWHHVPDPEAWEAVALAVSTTTIEAFTEQIDASAKAAIDHLRSRVGS